MAVKIKILDEKKRDNFLIFAQNIECVYTFEPHRGGSNVYPQSMF